MNSILSSNASSNIVFIDSNINNYQTLISGIENAEIVLLDSSLDGIEQITEQLSNYNELDSVQIISHGENGSVQLGKTLLNQNSLSGYADNLQEWGNAMSDDGDLLFYACNLADGADGFELIEQVSQLTQADVAASNDLTGHSSLGGDWHLEVTTGSIEASVALDQATQAAYQGQLNLLTNGSFEANAVENDRWEHFDPATVAGWQSLNGERLEIWDSGHNGVSSSEGSNHFELDYRRGSNLDAIYQEVQTTAGNTYELTFDVRARRGALDSATETVVVEWNGAVVTATDANSNNGWTTVTATVTGTGGRDRILLRESEAPGASDGYGPLLDNIEINPDDGFDRALALDGSGGIDVDDLTLSNDFTIETWVRFTPGEVISNIDGLVSSGVYGNGNDINFFASTPRIYSSGFGFRNDPVIATETVTDDQWTHYAFVREDGIAQIYIDGVLDSTSPQQWTSDFVIDEIGTAVSAGGLNGELDELRIWSVARTQAEIQANQDNSINASTTGLERYYTFDSGETIVDVTGNSSDVLLPSFGQFVERTENNPVIPNGAGFVEETIVSGLIQPTAFAYADDGRIFVTEKEGRVKIIENGAVVSTFIDINPEVNSYWDRGLVGIALDPDFDTNGWVYLNYTLDLEPETPDRPSFQADAGGRLVRVQASAANSNIADITTQEIILDGHEMSEATHTVGDIDFDNDGNLVFSWGDGGFRREQLVGVQDPSSKQGKFFRVDPNTGYGVPDNPFYDPANPDSVESKVLALGVRNPWRWSVDRPTGNIYFADVTDGGPEEINIIPTTITNPDKQLNFGWPYYEANKRSRHALSPDFDPNTFEYQLPYISLPHTGGYDAITGGAVYRGTAYPDAYKDRYFFGNFGPGTLYTADADGNFIQFGNFGEFSGPTDIQLAPDGTINYLSFVDGTLYRLEYDPEVAANQPVIPDARASASVTAGTGPLTVAFSSEGSSSPNGPQLQYQWDFNSDGRPDSTEANPTYTYDATGRQTAVLTVTDNTGAVDQTKVEVTVVETPSGDGNLAFGRPTFQSSNGGDSLSSRAVDGNTDNNFGNGSVAETLAQDKAYWEVDLGAVYDLDSIQVFLGQQARIDMRYILVSENPFSSGNLSAVLAEDGVESIFNRDAWVDETTVDINRRGRYLRIQLLEFDVLSLAEVKVFEAPIL